MHLEWVDYLIIGLFVAISLGLALYARKTAESGLEGFFLGGKNMPWYLAGLSMVATTFGADTPLAVTELVAQNGISGNWVWWNMLLGGMFTAIFYAQLWRRSGVVTEAEFITLRYSGKPALWLKRFKAVYLGVLMNAIILAWVNLALMSILQVFFDVPPEDLLRYTALAMLVVAAYSALSGLLGIALTDVFQFTIALGGCIVLAVLVLDSEQIGGVSGLKKALPEGSLDLFPSFGDKGGSGLSMTLASFFAFAGMIWWSSWYPGAEPGGGGYVAQRMLSTKNEKHSFLGTIFFQFAHYGLRPWPWIIVGLATIVLYPDLDDKKLGFVLAMKDFLPAGLRGLLLVAFLGAYMSTVSTHLNWGASYVVNDLYRWQGKSNRQIVWVSRAVTIGIMILALGVTTQIESITAVWEFIMLCGAGLGLLLMLRWFWFRINAWAEIAATVTPFVVYGIMQYGLGDRYPVLRAKISEDPTAFFITVGVTTMAWLTVTLLTRPTDPAQLEHFKEKIYPKGWETYRRRIPSLLLSWLFGVITVYSFLFATGKLIFREWSSALGLLGIMLIALIACYQMARRARLF